ncbi:hypothetical protein [Microbacterium sp. NPDC096154]|uniref:hypothetical protein n=1 Tax=Microbacterium sp. NPDC096154 TaxID=3155549 RepID=UPI003328438B
MTTSGPVKAAQIQSYEDGVRFGQLERMQANATPTLRGRYRLRYVWTFVKAVLMCAPLAALGVDFRDGATVSGLYLGYLADPGPDEFRRPFTFLALALAYAGQVAVVFDWNRRGRVREMWSSMAAFGALLCGVLLVWWDATRPVPDVQIQIGAAVMAAMGLIALALQLFFSRPGTLQEREGAALARDLRALPIEERAAIEAERVRILDVLRERGKIDDALYERALSAPLGDWWRLDAPGAGAKR